MDSTPNQLRAIITGASSGIGKATALAFANAGIDLALVSRSQEKLDAVAKVAAEVGVEAKTYALDLSCLEEIEAKIRVIASEFGSIDILVNSAGLGYTNFLQETSLSDWQRVMDLNFMSIVECVRGVLPSMRDRQRGTIINIASVAAEVSFPEWGAYSSSKAALVAFSQVLAAEERANGIRVVTISPGAVNTPLWETETVQANFDRSVMLTPETVAQVILQTALLPAEAVIEKMTILPSAGNF